MMQVANGTTSAARDSGIVARVIAVGATSRGSVLSSARSTTVASARRRAQPAHAALQVYQKLNGALRLYATKDASEQLRQIHKIALVISDRQRTDDLMIVTARATTPDGRTDEASVP